MTAQEIAATGGDAIRLLQAVYLRTKVPKQAATPATS